MKQALDQSLGALPSLVQERLERFEALLTRWNTRINLVAPHDLTHLWTRHIADSLQLVPLIQPDLSLTDLGSGAGFPGLILAMCIDNPVTLIEADSRKASFLREAAREAKTDVQIINARVEQATLPPAKIITARGLAPLPRLLEWAHPLLASDGLCLFLKGRKAEDELTDALAKWHMEITRISSRTDPDGVILALSHLHSLKAGRLAGIRP